MRSTFPLCIAFCSAIAAAPPDVAEPPQDAIRTVSGLAMTVLQAGSGADHPQGDDCAIVRFTAWKRDGALFSTSGLHGETSTQCLVSAIPGIAEALTAMTPGEKRRVWVPSQLAFAAHVAHHGTKLMPESPQAKVDLTIDVELVQILKAAEKPVDLKTPPPAAMRMPSGNFRAPGVLSARYGAGRMARRLKIYGGRRKGPALDPGRVGIWRTPGQQNGPGGRSGLRHRITRFSITGPRPSLYLRKRRTMICSNPP
jgi:hypothetical protein